MLEVAQNAKRCSKVVEQNYDRPTRVVDDWTLCSSVWQEHKKVYKYAHEPSGPSGQSLSDLIPVL